ncbi:MAG: hypothetical protein EOP11_12085 [Proteobacteria bacterium]|nr:MAG: hypothetical protein EOP11_12085 [Pseudomonadota bacterium]
MGFLLLVMSLGVAVSANAGELNLNGLWCNSGQMELEAGIRETRCGPGTVGITISHNGPEFRLAGVELLCGEEIAPVFLPFHLQVIEGDLYTSGFNVGSMSEEGAEFTLGNPDYTATNFTLRKAGPGALFYDEVTRDLEGWVINRNRGEFRLMPAGTRTCAGSAR